MNHENLEKAVVGMRNLMWISDLAVPQDVNAVCGGGALGGEAVVRGAAGAAAAAPRQHAGQLRHLDLRLNDSGQMKALHRCPIQGEGEVSQSHGNKVHAKV